MLLSVIVPVYNAEKYLSQCLNSLRTAWREGIEIVLVDDGSKDSSGKICDDFKQQHTYVKVVHQVNSGSVAARKRGVKEANGTYITAVDADDWVEPMYLAQMVDLLWQYEPDALVTSFTSVCNRKKTVYQNQIEVGFHQGNAMDAVRTQMLCCDEKPYQFGVFPSMWAKCFKKEMLERAFDQAPTDVSLGDDAMTTYPCLFNAQSIYVSDSAGYNYRTNEESMTRSYNAKLARQCVNLLRYFSQLADEYKGSFPKQVQAYGRFIVKNVFMNEFFKGNRGYRSSKESFKHFLNQEEVMTAVRMRERFDMSLKDRLFYQCLSWRVIFLPYVAVKMFF